MRRFLVPRTSIEKVNVKQPEVEVEETPPNVANEFNPNEIVRDPGCRKQIHEYAPDIQDQVRRAYILKGPTQPDLARFPRTQFGKYSRAFCKAWYKNYTWIEYSESKDATYCFYCFLFKDHIGSHDSKHNSCVKHYDDYDNQRQSVTSIFARATRESEELYKICLTCSLDCTRYLLAQGIAFRGHDESSTSLNKGNFREMLDWVKSNDEKVRDAFDHGPKNCTMTSGDIQKELAMCCAHEVTKVIMEELGDRQFSVLIDESRDISVKEQMAVMLRFLNDKGKVVERFIALHHVKYTTSEALKDALYVDDVKARLAILRETGWNDLFSDVQEFCFAQSILVPNMDEEIPVRGCSRREGRTVTNLHHYHVEIFYVAIDKICVEMDHWFCEGSNVVLDYFSCLDPNNSFSKFDVDKLARLANIYHTDFSDDDRGTIREQLETYLNFLPRLYKIPGSATAVMFSTR
ncbi:uncharacterized protein LOC131650431 [Vicia villosa]|uniref:uncharacterized protein LOC131650431 n=1 Tax=Vicia villosa TaxID=3911 RepID=UPI00273A8E59|nr:uncharacterized protein LOC131650431 [Vicia villosa]